MEKMAEENIIIQDVIIYREMQAEGDCPGL